jgi:5'-nucleotidase
MHRMLFALLALSTNLAFAAEPAPLTVIATTDFHGAVDGDSVTVGGGKTVTMGDPAVVSAYVNAIREAAPGPVIYLDAGDLFQGSMVSNMYEGAPIVRLYNYMQPAAAALGNHEFDYGPVGPKSVPRSDSDDGQGALKERIKEANFPFLAANVVGDDGKVPSWLKASIVKDVGGVRIGIVGASSANTPSTTNSLNLKGLHFLEPLDVITKEAQRLRKEGVSAVIVVIHEGGGCDDNDLSKVDDLSSCKIHDIFDLVKQLPEGLVDVVVAGHTHRGIAKRIGRTTIIQPYSQGKYVAWATVPLNGKGQSKIEGLVPVCTEVVSTRIGKTCDTYLLKNGNGLPEPATFLGKPVVADRKVEELLRPEVEQVKALKEASLGVALTAEFTRNYAAESPLANLMADISKTMVPGLDLGLINGGGIRANLKAGPLTYGDVFNMFPFDNQLAVMKVTGAQIIHLAELSLDGKRGVFTWSGNLKLEADGCKIVKATLDGKPLEPMRVYRVATSDFLAGGGSGVSEAKIAPEMITVYYDQEYLIRDLSAKGLREGKKVLDPRDYFDSAQPRIEIRGSCGTPR